MINIVNLQFKKMDNITDKRVLSRFSLPISVKYLLSDKHHGKVIAKDISMAGICLLLPQNIPSGTELTLVVPIHRRNRKTVIYGEIVWQRKLDDGYLTGIKFTRLDPFDIEKTIESWF